MYVGCRSCQDQAQLGALPGVIIGAVTSVNSVAKLVGLNSSDPVKDQQRIARIDGEFQKAMAGDQAAIACLESMAQGVANNDGRICAVGSQIAYRYAQVKWQEYQARFAAGGAGTWLVGQSTIPTTIAGMATSPLMIGAVVFGAWFLLRKRGR